MSFSFGLFLLPVVYAVILIFNPLGVSDPGYPSVTAMFLYSAFGILFLLLKPLPFDVGVRRVKLGYLFLLIVSFMILAWLFYIDRNFGHSPFIARLLRQPVSAEYLYARYRDQLPLRAVFPPLVTVLLFSSLLLFFKTRRNLINLSLTAWLGLVSTLFLGIYDTRHVLLWVFAYVFTLFFPYARNLFRLLGNLKILLLLVVGFAVLWGVFVYFGNIRTGLSGSEAKVFAIAMSVNSNYADLPMPAIWAIIYGFGNASRGIANDGNYALLDLRLPDKLFPGALQQLSTPNLLENLNSILKAQTFGIDAWHTFIIYFGYLGAIVFIVVFLSLSFFLVNKFLSLLSNGQRVSGTFYAVILWVSTRILLLSFGDYLVDFSAFVELLLLVLFFNFIGITAYSRSDRTNRAIAPADPGEPIDCPSASSDPATI